MHSTSPPPHNTQDSHTHKKKIERMCVSACACGKGGKGVPSNSTVSPSQISRFSSSSDWSISRLVVTDDWSFSILARATSTSLKVPPLCVYVCVSKCVYVCACVCERERERQRERDRKRPRERVCVCLCWCV